MTELSFGGGAAAALRRWAYEALTRHEAEGTLPTSLRHIFYEALMAEVIAKSSGGTRRADQNLTEAITWLRESGLVPWEWIEDRTRDLIDHVGDGEMIEEGVDGWLEQITIDPWEVLPILVVESESVAGVLDRIAAEWRSLIVPTRGQSNGWLRTAVQRRLHGRNIAVGYIGDTDEAGADIENNSSRVLYEVVPVKHWERLALTWAQVEAHGLPTVERTDRRDGVTYEVCEVEALPQRLLNDTVNEFFEGWLPEGVTMTDVQEREEAERAEVRRQLGIPW